MKSMFQYLLFNLDNEQFGLPLGAVQRVVRAVALTPVPQSPPDILGVLNLRGQVLPVINLRLRFGLPPKEMTLSDQLIIANAAGRQVAFVVDAVSGVIQPSVQSIVSAQDIFSGISHLEGGVQIGNRLIFIHKPEYLLMPEYADQLAAAIQQVQSDE